MGYSLIFSKIADRSENPIRFTRFVILFQLLMYLGYFPMTRLELSTKTTLLIMVGLAVVQTGCSSLKGVLDYKLPYQIVPLDRYGGMIFFNSAVNGAVGIGLSFCFSQIIAKEPMGQPYLWCMVLATGLLLTSLFCGCSVKPLETSASILHKNPMSTLQLLNMFRSPKFRAIIIPTMLRGVTFGITASIVLVMLNLGYTDAQASKLPIITALGCLVAAGIHHLLSHKVKMPNIGTIGSILLLAMAFLPRGNMPLFCILYLVAYTGQILMDCTIPIMIIQIVDPDIAGAFNAWRNTLLFLISTAATYVSSILLANGLTLVVLVAFAGGYSISMVMHKRLYYRFTDNAQ